MYDKKLKKYLCISLHQSIKKYFLGQEYIDSNHKYNQKQVSTEEINILIKQSTHHKDMSESCNDSTTRHASFMGWWGRYPVEKVLKWSVERSALEYFEVLLSNPSCNFERKFWKLHYLQYDFEPSNFTFNIASSDQRRIIS